MRVNICLETPPTISSMGIPRHGEARLWDDYLLPEHWCFHIYSYQAILELDGVPCQIRPGWASLVPPGTRMTYKYSGSSEHVYFHFKPIIGSHTYEVPMVFDLRERYQEFNSRARSAVELGGRLSGLASAHLWSLLWDSTIPEGDHSRSKSAYGHPAVEMATRHIEQRLGTRLSVAELCKEVGVSYGYLTRLFTAHVGVSVSDYVRKRRADEAEHLLRSTTLPIKVIARTVGLPDLQRFNRLMHTAKGMSP